MTADPLTPRELTAAVLVKFDAQMQAWRAAGKTYAPIRIEDLAALRESLDALIARLLEWESNLAPYPPGHPYRQGVQSVVDDMLDFLGVARESR